jgi:hypothetical protein
MSRLRRHKLHPRNRGQVAKTNRTTAQQNHPQYRL